MTSDHLKKQVFRIFRNVFPFDNPVQNPDSSQSSFQFHHSLTGIFVNRIADISETFNEYKAGSILSILRNDISEKTKEEFYGVYQFSQSFEDSYVHNWSGFLDSVRWKSLRRIEPKNALCLEHLRHFSVEQRAQLLGLVISLFSNSYGIESWLSLHRLLRVKNRLEKVLGGGHDAYSYTIDSEFVNLEDDGDGALPEEEIIKIRLTHEEFERLIVVWQSSLIHDLRFSSHEIAFLKL